VPESEQFNECLFMHTYKSNKTKIVMNEMRVNVSDMCVR